MPPSNCRRSKVNLCAPVELQMIVVVQNDPEVPPGLVADLLSEKRVRFRLIRLFAGERLENLDQSHGVIVLGGIMSVRDIDEFPFLQRLKERRAPERLHRHKPGRGLYLSTNRRPPLPPCPSAVQPGREECKKHRIASAHSQG